jgi:hypothetical protein
MSNNEIVLTAERSEPSMIEKGTSSFFGRKRAVVEHPPRFVVIDYREGTEKSVRQAVKSDMVDVSRNMGWGKQGISHHLVKVQGHPKLEDGYAYEIQNSGDGGSYLEDVLERLKSPNVHQIWIPCSKEWAFIECKNGRLETSFSPLPPEDDDVLVTPTGKPQLMRPLFVESYAFFYVSLVMLILSVLSFPIASVFKHVLLNETKVMIDKNYYTKDKFMPISQIRKSFDAVIDSNTQRITAVKYSPSKGWSLVSEELDGGAVHQYEQKVSSDGTISDRVKIKEGEADRPASDGKKVSSGTKG